MRRQHQGVTSAASVAEAPPSASSPAGLVGVGPPPKVTGADESWVISVRVDCGVGGGVFMCGGVGGAGAEGEAPIVAFVFRM